MNSSSGGHATAVACIATAGALAGLIYFTKPLLDRLKIQRKIFSEYFETMDLPLSKMRALKDDFLQEVKAGLSGEQSSLLMLPSMIDILPTGDETGDVFAIDIGGTNMRMVYVQLAQGRGQVEEHEDGGF
eukprot:jgi/Botrbrau1/6929/Bobra.0215s0008.1